MRRIAVVLALVAALAVAAVSFAQGQISHTHTVGSYKFDRVGCFVDPTDAVVQWPSGNSVGEPDYLYRTDGSWSAHWTLDSGQFVEVTSDDAGIAARRRTIVIDNSLLTVEFKYTCS